jgi:hypothetical protein
MPMEESKRRKLEANGWRVGSAAEFLGLPPYDGFLELKSPSLSPEIEAAIDAQHGGPVSVAGQHGKYVIMNAELFGGIMEAMPEELADSVAAIKRSLVQAAAGQTRDADEALDELESR